MKRYFPAVWWRFSAYERLGRFITPCADAEVFRYNPWEAYARERSSSKGKGGGRMNPPYLDLIEFADARRPSGPRSYRWTQQEGKGNVLEWCGRNGLLGLFLMEARQVTLYPRWKPAKIESDAKREPWPTLVTDSCDPGGWSRWTMRAKSNIDVITLPPEQKPVDGLVPQQYWDPQWEQPGVLVRRSAEHPYYHATIEAEFQDFFPSVPPNERETFDYPTPFSDEFQRMYSEPENEFCGRAYDFADDVRTLATYGSEYDTTPEEEKRVRQALDNLEFRASQTSPGLSTDDHNRRQMMWTGSLLGAYAMMALRDAADGLLNACGNCDRIFVSSAGRAKFCSNRCRRAAIQRGYRERKGGAIRIP